jgi:hypothetical protein
LAIEGTKDGLFRVHYGCRRWEGKKLMQFSFHESLHSKWILLVHEIIINTRYYQLRVLKKDHTNIRKGGW